MNTENSLISSHREILSVVSKLDLQFDTIIRISNLLINTINNNGIIYFCGNGGSAADCQHIVAEFVGRFLKERKALPAIALTTNTSILTAIGNDYSFENIFARQVEALLKPKDCLVSISTSGKSKNINQATITAKHIGCKTIGFTGNRDTNLQHICDLSFVVDSDKTPHIQEVHLIVWHMICDIVEQKLSIK